MKLLVQDVEFTDEMKQELTATISSELKDILKQRLAVEKLPEYMSKKQAALYLNVSANTLNYKLIPAGLKVTDIDGLIRISKSNCDEFMKNHEY